MLSKMREPVNGLTHFGGAIAATVGLIMMLFFARNAAPIKYISVLIYGITLILLFSASSIYHSVKAAPETLNLLRKLDHSAIFLLIAGTYTPICINVLTGFFRWGFLLIIWLISIIGIFVKVRNIDAPKWFSAGVYVLLGWLCIFAFGQLNALLTPLALGCLISGGVFYTVGAIIYSAKLLNFIPGKFGSHEVWHIFVLLGASAHFILILGIITNQL